VPRHSTTSATHHSCAGAFEALDFWRDLALLDDGGDAAFDEATAPFPKLRAMYDAVDALGRIREWRAEKSEEFLPLAEYAGDVNSTLYPNGR
jgi:hypothetical protein